MCPVSGQGGLAVGQSVEQELGMAEPVWAAFQQHSHLCGRNPMNSHPRAR